MDDLYAKLSKIAVIGLQNQPDYELSPELHTLLAEAQCDNEAQRLLHALTLAVMQQELAQLPRPQRCDELPEIPAEWLQSITQHQRHQLQALFQFPSRNVMLAVALWLQRERRVLPESLLLEYMETYDDRISCRYLALVASARFRWLLAMNRSWAGSISQSIIEALKWVQNPALWLDIEQNSETFTRWDKAAQQAYLQKLYRYQGDELLPFIYHLWQHCNADGRKALWPYVYSVWLNAVALDEPAQQWLQSALNDKSKPIKFAAICLRAHHAKQTEPDWYTEIKQQLSQFIDASKPKKPDLNPPETLSLELKQLGMIDDDTYGLSKAVVRLGQLLVLTGPAVWAELLQCNSVEALRRLAKSRFKEELEPFLLEACIRHHDLAALAMWCQQYKRCKYVKADILSAWLINTGSRLIPPVIDVLLAQKRIELLFCDKLWRAMAQFGLVLSGVEAQQLFTAMAEYLHKRRVYLNTGSYVLLGVWLQVSHDWLTQQKFWPTLKDKIGANEADGLVHILRLTK